MERKYGLKEKAADAFELPADTVAGVPKVTITGGNRVLVENHRGILEYGREFIAVNGGKVKLCINGDSLELLAMSRGELLIKGTIYSTEFI